MTPRITTHQRRAILGHRPTDSDTVSSFCKDHGISRDSYYRIKSDTNPLVPQSTAPQQPHTNYPELTWVLVRQFRISLAEAGYDDGRMVL